MSQTAALVEKLLLDDSFYEWIHSKEDSKWNEWVKKNSVNAAAANEAEELIRSVEFETEVLIVHQKKKLKSEIDDKILIHNYKSRRGTNRIWWYAAASIVFICLSISIIFLYNSRQDHLVKYDQTERIKKVTQKGQKLTINLPDGSIVTLNSSSSIAYNSPFDSTCREVFLSGEAFFSVRRDSLKPFIVVAGETKTTVLGTSFNINTSSDQVEVALVTGVVKVERNSGEIVNLSPGESAVIQQGKNIRKLPFNKDVITSWKNGILYFDDTSLREVFNKIEQWYGIDITHNEFPYFSDNYAGYYDNQNLEQVLNGLSFVYDFEFEILDNHKVNIKFSNQK
ncbi:MAG: FecR domain-containing protein [Cytophagales bacterium]|nr:FecR domain-containing protein [Cytophagales bacterium]